MFLHRGFFNLQQRIYKIMPGNITFPASTFLDGITFVNAYVSGNAYPTRHTVLWWGWTNKKLNYINTDEQGIDYFDLAAIAIPDE